MPAGLACYELVSPSNVVGNNGCSAGYAADVPPEPQTLTESGTWYIGFNGPIPQGYSFSFGVNCPPAPVFP